MNMDVVESALEILRPGLAQDGFALYARPQNDGEFVQIVLEAKADACLDCLVPDDMLIQVIEQALREQDPSARRVELVKLGFDDLNAH